MNFSEPEEPKGEKQEVKLLSNGKVMKVQKARQRKILSCVYCHSKKIKCSRQFPTCNNCDKLGIDCKYFVNERVSRGGKNGTPTAATSANSSNPGSSGSTPIPKPANPDVDMSTLNNTRTDLGYSTSNSPIQDSLRVSTEPQSGDSEPFGATFALGPTPSFPNLQGLQLIQDNQIPQQIPQQLPQQPQPPQQPQQPQQLSNSKSKQIPNLMGQPSTIHVPAPIPVQSNVGQSLQNGASNYPSQPSQSPQPNQLHKSHSRSILQLPVMNSFNNNITNNYFNNIKNEEQYSFNLSSFPYNNIQNNSAKLLSTNTSSTNLMGQAANLTSHNNSSNNISSLFLKNPSHLLAQNNIGLETGQNQSSANLNKSGMFEISENVPQHPKTFLNGTNPYYDNVNLLDELETCIPSTKEKSFDLVNRYVSSVHCLLPILVNIDDFVEEHEKYWKDCNPYEKQTNNGLTDFNLMQFYNLYFPVLYSAAISEFEEYDNLLLNHDIDKYLQGFSKICQHYNYPHGIKSVPLLMGNVIIQSASPNPSTMEIAQIIRYAKFLQLDKDPVLSLEIKSFEVIQFRRLLWWVIFGLDCASSYDYCLPPVCKFNEFNVMMPSEEEIVHNDKGEVISYRLNLSILCLNVRFKFDRIVNDLVYQLYGEPSANITIEKMNEVKQLIVQYFSEIHLSINNMTYYHKMNPPTSVNEINLQNFIKNQSWSFADRALMLLHKKFLLNEFNGDDNSSLKYRPSKLEKRESNYNIHLTKATKGKLSFAEFDDTYHQTSEKNIIKNLLNFKNLNLNLNFNQFNNYDFYDLNNNLIPSILHNFNDFLKYNDFLKFGRYNWYVKRIIPLDSLILLFLIIIVKFKLEMIKFNELIIYVKLINKTLFIFNRKWFKNEKYKRMLSLTNLTWEYILKKFNILNLINKFTNSNFSISGASKNKIFNKYEYFNYQLTGYINTTELFKTMEVPQPILSMELIRNLNGQKQHYEQSRSQQVSPSPGVERRSNGSSSPDSPPGEQVSALKKKSKAATINGQSRQNKKATFDLMDDEEFSINEKQVLSPKNDMNLIESNELFSIENDFKITKKLYDEVDQSDQELLLLKEKIEFDLRNNYVDINEYCAFYISLENMIYEMIQFIDA